MIASVIAKFNPDGNQIAATIQQIATRPGFEIGTLVENHALPMTIETGTPAEMETLTRWLQSLADVAFVDVVFVYLENENQTT